MATSPAEKSRCQNHYNRANWLFHDIRGLTVDQRLGFMAKIIAAAREHDSQLRGILTDPMLYPVPRSGDRWLYRRDPYSSKTIAQAADAYCLKFWGRGVKEVVYKRCAEPPTGEVGDTDGYAPRPAPPRKRKPAGWDYRHMLPAKFLANDITGS